MKNTFRQLFEPKNKDIRRKILFTLVVLFIFKLGTTITVPGTSAIVQDLGFLELMNAMSGGALQQFSIFALGVTPYINASIIMQLLQMDIIPYFSDLKNQGPTGRRKLNQISRYLGMGLAFIQGYIFSFAFYGANAGVLEYMKIALILTAGTALVLWLGDQVTQKGIGNGVSLIIMAGIIASLPSMFITAFNTFVDFSTTQATILGLLMYLFFIVVYLLIVVGIIFVQQAERRIPIQYANRTTSAYGGQQTYMPIKINSAGVIPVIFASVLISIPTTIASFANKAGLKEFIEKYINYDTATGFVLYMILIFFFAYFYTFMQINPEELSSNLNKNGGYIPGVKPGKETTKHIKYVISKITIVGSIFLMILAAMPIVFSKLSGLPSSISIGGTGLLIVVGVALETYNQIESQLIGRTHKRSYK